MLLLRYSSKHHQSHFLRLSLNQNKRKKRFGTPYTSTQMFKPFIPRINSQYIMKMPTQSEIRKLLTSLRSKNLKFHSYTELKTRSRLFDFEKMRKKEIMDKINENKGVMRQINDIMSDDHYRFFPRKSSAPIIEFDPVISAL